MSNTIKYQQVHSPEPPVARTKAMKWTCMAAVIAAAVLYSYISASNVPVYQAAIELSIAFGAVVITFASLHGKLYSFTGLLGAIVLIFALLGNWSILLASILPFAGSLIWMRERTRRIPAPASLLGH